MYPELQLLGRWTHTGTLSAGNSWSPAPIAPNSPNLPQGKLNGNQVGAVAFAVIHSPVDGTTIQDLDRVQLVLDGQPYPNVWYEGKKSSLTAPDPRKVRVGEVIWLGDAPYTQDGGPADPIKNTAPKFIDSVSVKAYAGTSDITADFTAEVYGWVYNSVKLAGFMPVYGGVTVPVYDALTGHAFNVEVPQVEASGDWRGAWTALPGGGQQSSGNGTPISKIVRRAQNANATVASENYRPEYLNSSDSPAVKYSDDNLYFTLNARQALLIEGWGVNGPVAPNSSGNDLKAAWIQTPDESGHGQHPRGGRAADYQLGTTRFGLIPGATDRYAGISRLDVPILSTNETVYLTFIDNGTSIAADDVSMAFIATLLGPTGQGGV